MNKKHIGSDFEDFLRGENLFEEVDALAIKRVIALQIRDEMKEKNIAKAELARRMKSSRSEVDRLLDPNNASITLITLEKAATAVGKRLTVQLSV
ncbi:MAG: helix-turn-helix domain-containing protein [Clostridiales Family XIII bacterium]|jgi:predicted XRE-type DNA-binding protein|nr:helix-turn-helix domain-containing protein [Clostridiales Family XIII bacterium]